MCICLGNENHFSHFFLTLKINNKITSVTCLKKLRSHICRACFINFLMRKAAFISSSSTFFHNVLICLNLFRIEYK